MKPKVEKAVNKIDWKLLNKQRLALATVLDFIEEPKIKEALGEFTHEPFLVDDLLGKIVGIQNMLDILQDAQELA